MTKELHRELAKVRTAEMRMERGCFATLVLSLDYGWGGQSFCPVLDAYSKPHGERVGTAEGLEFIRQVMLAFDVEELSRIKGRTVFALLDREGLSGTIVGIELPSFDGGKRVLVSDVFRGPSTLVPFRAAEAEVGK